MVDGSDVKVNVEAPNVVMVPGGLLALAHGRANPLTVTLAVAALSTGWGRGGARATTDNVVEVLGVEERKVRRALHEAKKAGALEEVKDKLTGQRWVIAVGATAVTSGPKAPETDPKPRKREKLTKEESTLHQALVTALLRSVILDRAALSKPGATVEGIPTSQSLGARAGKYAKKLREADVHPEVIYAARRQWDASDWRGKKGQKPTLDQLMDVVAQVMAHETEMEARSSSVDIPGDAKRRWLKLHKDWMGAGGVASGQPKPPSLAAWWEDEAEEWT